MRSKSQTLMDSIIEFIDNEYCSCGKVPTMREIAISLKISKSCVSNYIAEMKRKGMIEKENCWHGISTKIMEKTSHSFQYIPVINRMVYDDAILNEENIETYLPIPIDFLGIGKHFILRAINDFHAGFSNGDYVIVRQQDHAESGQISVVFLENELNFEKYNAERNENERKNIKGIAVKVIKSLC